MNSPDRGTVDIDDDYCTLNDDDRTIPSETEVKRIQERLYEAVNKIKINLIIMFNNPVFVKREQQPIEEVEHLMENLSLSSNPERKENNADSLYPENAKIRTDEFVLYRRQSRTEGDQIDYFAKISDEVVLSIFSWLPKSSLAKCSSVCKRWRDLSYDCTLWKRYDFGRKLIKPHGLGKILSRGVSILRLAMADIKSPISSDIFYQEPRYSNLQYLDISLATIDVKGLADLLSLCIHLRKLSLENCELNEDCLLSIAQNPYLTVLNMSMCSGLTPAGMHAISTKCTRLKEWNLAWTDLTIQCMESFLPFIPKGIERLNLSGHRDTLNDNGLIVIFNRCPNLLELDISDCPLISELALEVMVKQCSKLRELHSSRSYHIPAYCNRHLKNLNDFKELDIFCTLTDKSLNALRKLMPEVSFNQNMFSTIARPTTGIRRTSIWGLRVRD
ncbi:s-phase kinase-associated protein 2 [Caerostris extrusa]|uniref:S-phase kinase-associated protein 2 n=1 Tax=Caerostris extrusa TaxID=172846 RepID=A0AAV4RN78_CAEEX|nr:s-phase kinase-associated protein 2 [Caerostris extrusa]